MPPRDEINNEQNIQADAEITFTTDAAWQALEWDVDTLTTGHNGYGATTNTTAGQNIHPQYRATLAGTRYDDVIDRIIERNNQAQVRCRS